MEIWNRKQAIRDCQRLTPNARKERRAGMQNMLVHAVPNPEGGLNDFDMIAADLRVLETVMREEGELALSTSGMSDEQ